MNCQEFAAVLDDHRLSRLAPAARSALDTHAVACRSCADALAAVEALTRDPIPAAPAAVPQPPRRRAHLRRVAAVSFLSFAGVALAATALVAMHTAWQRAHGADAATRAASSADRPAVPSGGATAAAPAAPMAYVRAAERAARKRFNAALMSAPDLPDGDFFPLLHPAPAYPSAAAARKLEGFAVGEFTITADGDVADVHIVKSSNPVFDAPTIAAIRESKYKPRIVGGKPVPVEGARLRIVYVLRSPHADGGAKKPAPAPPEPQDAFSRQRFEALLAGTMSCVRANDLNCIELNLDRIRATYPLTRDQRERLLRIEGFVQHREGNYERAIAAYRKAAALEAEEGASRKTQMIIAHIYYERQEYQPALDAALRYLRRARHPAPADFVFVDRLRQLGAVVR